MTFYLNCSQSHQRSAVMRVARLVQVMSRSASAEPTAYFARLDTSVAAGSKVYVLNVLRYDSDSIAYFFIVLTS